MFMLNQLSTSQNLDFAFARTAKILTDSVCRALPRVAG